MSCNDPIAHALTKIRNAMQAKHKYVDLELSNARKEIIEILKQNGFIDSYISDTNKRRMRIFLKYKARQSIIQGLKRISKPGLRQYVSSKKIPKVYNGLGIAILSTSKGVMDGETARKQKLGGELWCYVW